MRDSYEYKKGMCVHCGKSLICGKGVAHFKCSYKAQEDLDHYRDKWAKHITAEPVEDELGGMQSE